MACETIFATTTPQRNLKAYHLMDYNFSHTSSDNTAVISFEGELNIYSASELKNKFLDLLDSHEQLIVELNNVTSIDTSGIQILIFLKREADLLKKKLILKSHNQVVLRFFDLYGLVGYFADKIVILKEDKEKFKFSYGTKLHPDRILYAKK